MSDPAVAARGGGRMNPDFVDVNETLPLLIFSVNHEAENGLEGTPVFENLTLNLWDDRAKDADTRTGRSPRQNTRPGPANR